MDANYGKAESLIQEVSGCGPFQALVVFFAFVLTKMPAMFSLIFMSFGNFNPGWRCLDNTTAPFNESGDTSNVSIRQNQSQDDYFQSCSQFDACVHVEFNPEHSTIVSEWGLICGRSWITSFIISLQMAGALIGSCLAGQLGDMFGRKTIIYGSLALLGVFNFISVFAISWQMYTVLKFLLGVFSAAVITLNIVLVSEFVTLKWRGAIAPIPTWEVSGVIFGVACLIFKTWRAVHIVTTAICVITFIPVFWVPESLRWLYVKKKEVRFRNAVNKMLRLNKKNLQTEQLQNLSAYEDMDDKRYSMVDLFRKGFRMHTCLIGFLWLSVGFIYWAISLGVKNMHGDFYINLIVLFAIVVPTSIFPIMAPNIIGRKKSVMIFFGLTLVGLVLTAVFEIGTTGRIKTTGSTVFVMVSKIAISAAFNVMFGYTGEIYPTVVRSLSLGFGTLMARLGGIIAPYIIHSSRESFYIGFLIMAAASFVCCLMTLRLPETKGKRLQETFDQTKGEVEDRKPPHPHIVALS